MSSTISRLPSPQTAIPPSPVPAPPAPARPAAEQLVLERAAKPKHLGAAVAKRLRGLLSSVSAEEDRLKDAAKNALSAYNAEPSGENKRKFLDAFRELKYWAPSSGYSSHVRAHGEETNPAFDKFLKKIAKLQDAYNILTKEDKKT